MIIDRINSEIETLKGKTIDRIYVNESKDEITFCVDEEKYLMYHEQDCCESVSIEEIIGDLEDLLNSPIILSEKVSQSDEQASESGTWTFYKLATVKGYVTIRWYGESNGYYSEEVDFIRIIESASLKEDLQYLKEKLQEEIVVFKDGIKEIRDENDKAPVDIRNQVYFSGEINAIERMMMELENILKRRRGNQ